MFIAVVQARARWKRKTLSAGWRWLVIVLGLVAFPLPVPAEVLAPEELYRNTLPSVMTLEVETRNGGKIVGTAFLAFREGVAVTAWHLLPDAKKVIVRFADHKTVAVAGVIDYDVIHDVALVKLDVASRALASLCHSNPAVGARVYAIGSPKGYEFSISDGLINQLQVVDGFLQYQFSCPISPGNSGGPVLNARGEVLGVVTWSRKDAQNLNFATPSACLLALNPQAEVIPWSSLKKQHRNRQRTQVAGYEREPLARGSADRELAALRTLLKKSAGEAVTVTVCRGSEPRTFKIVVPEDFVK
jgi:S1-C subfamily serine protease